MIMTELNIECVMFIVNKNFLMFILNRVFDIFIKLFSDKIVYNFKTRTVFSMLVTESIMKISWFIQRLINRQNLKYFNLCLKYYKNHSR